MTCVLHNSISTRLHLHLPNMPPVLGSAQSPANQSPASRDLENLQTPNASTPSSTTVSPRDEIINFLAGLNVSIEVVASVCQQIMSMYDLWDSFTDHSEQDRNRRVERRETQVKFMSMSHGNPPPEKTLVTEREIVAVVNKMRSERYVILICTLWRPSHLREQRENDLLHPASGRLVAENPRLVRASREPT